MDRTHPEHREGQPMWKVQHKQRGGEELVRKDLENKKSSTVAQVQAISRDGFFKGKILLSH